jgi:hypothetical protein
MNLIDETHKTLSEEKKTNSEKLRKQTKQGQPHQVESRAI